MLCRTLAELRSNQSLRRHLSQRLRHLVVDEYQDVSWIQETVAKELHGLGAAAAGAARRRWKTLANAASSTRSSGISCGLSRLRPCEKKRCRMTAEKLPSPDASL